MNPTHQPSDPATGKPLDRDVAADPTSGTEDEVVQGKEGEIPVQGDEETAEDLARKAFGDKDHEGEGDVPNAPFPG